MDAHTGILFATGRTVRPVVRHPTIRVIAAWFYAQSVSLANAQRVFTRHSNSMMDHGLCVSIGETLFFLRQGIIAILLTNPS